MEPLKIGQSLTPEQVRSLPDGAKVRISQDHCHWLEFTACHQIREFLHDAIYVWAFSATLVSLPTTEPSEPSPGDGYRWLVPKVDALASGDQYPDGSSIFESDIGYECNSLHTYRRRIDPQATCNVFLQVGCGCIIKTREALVSVKDWIRCAHSALGHGLSERGIHTLAELDKRLAPDPQVSDDVKLAFAGLTDLIAARDYLDTLISAQRGEVEG